jgi:hypothetical protein
VHHAEQCDQHRKCEQSLDQVQQLTDRLRLISCELGASLQPGGRVGGERSVDRGFRVGR